jgi:hypothetical protein
VLTIERYIAGEAGGALTQTVIGDKLGRIRFMQLACVIVTIGVVIQTASVNMGMVSVRRTRTLFLLISDTDDFYFWAEVLGWSLHRRICCWGYGWHSKPIAIDTMPKCSAVDHSLRCQSISAKSLAQQIADSSPVSQAVVSRLGP